MQKKQRSSMIAVLLVLLFGLGMFAVGSWLSGRLQGDSSTGSQTDAPATSTSAITTPTSGRQITTEDLEDDTSDIAAPLTSEQTAADESAPAGPIVRPELEGIKAFVPDGGRFVRYWYSNMNDDDYDEVLFGYLLDNEVHIAALGVLDQDRYHVLWDEVTPGSYLVELITSKLDSIIVIQVETTQGEEGGFFSLYAYGDTGMEVFLFEQGPYDKANTVIALSSVALSESSSLPFSAALTGRTLSILSGPIISADGQSTVTEDRYNFSEGVLTFESEAQVVYEE